MHRRDHYITEIYDLLYQLGIIANYTGFFYTSYAILLIVENPERILLITKRLYPEVAKKYDTNWKAVERNIRTIVSLTWERNPQLLQEFARHILLKKPTNAEFLAILAKQVPLPPLTELNALAIPDDLLSPSSKTTSPSKVRTLPPRQHFSPSTLQ